jgi:hypothetical protein
MAAKTIGDLAGWTGQIFDFEAVSTASTDWVPTKAGATMAIMCITAGTPTMDMLGINASSPTLNTAWPLAMTAGQVLQIAVTKIHKTGTTGTYLALY